MTGRHQSSFERGGVPWYTAVGMAIGLDGLMWDIVCLGPFARLLTLMCHNHRDGGPTVFSERGKVWLAPLYRVQRCSPTKPLLSKLLVPDGRWDCRALLDSVWSRSR